MRLTRVRIEGFKSFVDPTDLKLPSALVGIVGPNGCGKSNTIDAVRWVMGESSARHLRGESMDDVIFTGSSSRKPVGKALVELVFDNADGSLGGEYAKYAEIAVRREVERDGASRYLLNNVRCRRRDIRDLFLGTGLGPRSYAIIEQGMISRLIEAKPEDLRVFLEEAAGISKYKERRRETETRIRHTRDNLDRLDDLREEVDKQLAHLRRQANTAERYQALKGDQHRLRGELLALRRREFVARRDEAERAAAALDTELERVVAELRAAEAAIEQAREQRREASDGFAARQQELYRVGTEVARLEQSIEHVRQSRSERSRELAETDRALDEARRHLEEDAARIAGIAAALDADAPAFDSLADVQRESAAELAAAEGELVGWQAERDALAGRRAEAEREAQVERSRIEQLERALGGARARRERLASEAGTLDAAPLERAIEEGLEAEIEGGEDEARLEAALADGAERRAALGAKLETEGAALDVARARRSELVGRLASLEALQQAALEPEGSAGQAWLERAGLASRERLGARLAVEPGWERAVEVALDGLLEAVTLDGPGALEAALADAPDAGVALVVDVDIDVGELPGPDARPASREAASGDVAGIPDGAVALADLVRGPRALVDLLAGVHGVDSAADAVRLRAGLAPGRSLVTRDGLRVGAGWLRAAPGGEGDGVLLRGAEIERLHETLEALDDEIRAGEARREELAATLREHEARRETQQHAYNDAVRSLSEVRARLRTERARLEQVRARAGQLDAEREELDAALEADDEALAAAAEARADALARLEAMADETAALGEEERGVRERVSAARARSDSDRDAGQELAIRVESMKSARAATEQNVARVQSRIAALAARRDELDALFAAADEDPVAALEASLEDELGARLAAEEALAVARAALDEVESRMGVHEGARARHDGAAQALRGRVQELRVGSQEVLVRLATVDEQIAEHDYDPAALDAGLEASNAERAAAGIGSDAATRAKELGALEARIGKLGPINLAAIDEHAERLERKEYLDSQHSDVTEALETLERAIAKIDRETRARFRETYEAVNEKFEGFFPRLFGGGEGRLELVGDDLLSTGVTVRAQPPGKRVTNIQLLSGGEKALTAVALVFAFFELNPSPFCMLDEVDAPLDDANVGRFCELVREMSERVQFIFITHNKVTMELAEQLLGVTMNEPGVSRLVAVDVHEAVELAGA